MTIDEARQKETAASEARKDEIVRLATKVLCAEVTFPAYMQRNLGITGYTMKADELCNFVEQEIENRDGNTVTFTIKFSKRTNKWIENLPEADV